MLPKYVTCFYARDRWVVMSDCLVVHETTFNYSLAAWLFNNGYEQVTTETWTRGPKQAFITSYNGQWGVYPAWAEHPDQAWSWHDTKQEALDWAREQGLEDSNAEGVVR